MNRLTNVFCEELDLTRKYEQLKHDHKPRGLWYSLGTDWVEWCEGNMEDWVRPYYVEIEIDESKMLIIDSAEKIIELTPLYQVPIYPGASIYNWDWEKLKKDYAGIEIRNYYALKWGQDRRELWKVMWLMGWDVDSGCIWDLSIVKSQKSFKCEKYNEIKKDESTID